MKEPGNIVDPNPLDVNLDEIPPIADSPIPSPPPNHTSREPPHAHGKKRNHSKITNRMLKFEKNKKNKGKNVPKKYRKRKMMKKMVVFQQRNNKCSTFLVHS